MGCRALAVCAPLARGLELVLQPWRGVGCGWGAQGRRPRARPLLAGKPQGQALVGTGKGACAGWGRRGRILGGRPGEGEAQRWGRTRPAPDGPWPELRPHHACRGVPGPAPCVWAVDSGMNGTGVGVLRAAQCGLKEKRNQGGGGARGRVGPGRRQGIGRAGQSE